MSTWPEFLAHKPVNTRAEMGAYEFLCGNDWHAEDCEFGKEVARRLKAERDAHRLAFENEQLRREAERLQKLLTAMHQIAGELARPSGI